MEVGPGSIPNNFQKTGMQMVQSELFWSFICEKNEPVFFIFFFFFQIRSNSGFSGALGSYAVSSPLDRSKSFTLFAPPPPPGRPVHSDTNSAIHSAITRNDYSLTCLPLSIARYSFIQLSELERRGET